MVDGLKSLWQFTAERANELCRAAKQQASIPATWPALALLAVSHLAMPALATFFLYPKQMIEALGPWLSMLSFPLSLYGMILHRAMHEGIRIMRQRLELHGRLIIPGMSPADDALIAEVAIQAAAMKVRTPEIYVVYSSGTEIDDDAFAHTGFFDRGRVALRDTLVAKHQPAGLRFVIRHELAHIKHRDGFVRGAILLLRHGVEKVARDLFKPFLAFCIAMVLLFLAMLALTLHAGQSVEGAPSAAATTFMPLLVIVGGVLGTITAIGWYVQFVSRAQELAADRAAAAGLPRADVQAGLSLLTPNDPPQGGWITTLRWRLVQTHPSPEHREGHLRKLGLV